MALENAAVSHRPLPGPRPAPSFPVPSKALDVPPAVRAGGVMTVGPSGLFAFAPDLERLATRAVEANPFYELSFLEPALRNLRGSANVELALVFTPDANPQRPARLTGFFPVEIMQPFPGAPIRAMRMWRHRHCFLTAPLVDASAVDDVLDRFFGWAASRAAFVEARTWPAEGPLDRALMDVIRRREAGFAIRERWQRACLEPAKDAAASLEQISGGSRKELRRLEKHLAEQGAIEFDALVPGADAEPWLGEFLSLEASGWKGREGSALASRTVDGAFFLDAARAAHRGGRLEMVRMHVGGRPVASKCNLRSAAGPSFAFKIAFDEAFAKFSPGVLLELENIRHVHRANGPSWMDSCAEAGHPMIERIWSGRRSLQSIVVSTGARGGDACVAMLPLLAWVKGLLKKRTK